MASAPEPLFDPEPVVAALRRGGIRVVVVGALVARIRGFAAIETRDLDLVPDLDPENLQRLAETLHALGATVRVENHAAGPVRLPEDGGLIAKAPILNLHVPGVGDVDVIHQAANPTAARPALTYTEMSAGASEERLPGTHLVIAVMSEADWVHAKETPPVREKDAMHLAVYRARRSEGETNRA